MSDAPSDAKAILDELLAAAGRPASGDQVELRGADPVLPTPFRAGELGTAAIAAVGLEAARLMEAATGKAQTVSVDVDAGAAAMRSWTYLKDVTPGVVTPPRGPDIRQFFHTKDDRWIFLHRRAAHHAARQEQVLGCGHAEDEVVAAVEGWNAEELEEAIVANGACAAMARTHDEWTATEQAAAVAGMPLLRITRIGDSDPVPLPAADRPLSGLRVIDLTHVLAGPTCARTLAEHGADVLRIGRDGSGDGNPMQRDTGHGKRSTVLDLKKAEDADVLRGLLREADVFSQGFRPGAVTGLGFSPEEVAALRPGAVCVSLSAFGSEGPWRDRRGYDSVVQSASGICVEVAGPDGEPRFLPVSALDYVTGYLAAFAVLVALQRRATEGGSYHVELSLAQTGHYFDRLGRVPAEAWKERAPELPAERLDDLLTERETPFGRLRHLRPVTRMSLTPAEWELPTVPMAHDAPEWRDAPRRH